MQFHLNGFRPGDPRAAEAAPDAVPGSVTLAAQLAAFADIHTCILEQKDGPPLVVGCDGARSAVRPAIGRQLVGDSANQAWGVMDLLAVTDFPDIRCKVAVQSAHANLLVIPREGGYLVRLDVEMDKLGEAERVASRHIGIDLEVKEVPWWSVYEMGQRICDKYDDVPAQELGTRQPRVFIAGDACHTHSPKAG
jgi:2-polyprenyl-6-methoxyphenol hydroxylase-like FAD-dependent oxidoreductase